MLKQQKFYLLTGLEAGSLQSKCQHGQVLVRILFLGCRWPPSGQCSHDLSLACVHRKRGRWMSELSGFSSCEDANPVGSGVRLMTSFNHNFLRWPHLQIQPLWGLGLQHKDFGRGTKHSVHSSGFSPPFLISSPHFVMFLPDPTSVRLVMYIHVRCLVCIPMLCFSFLFFL